MTGLPQVRGAGGSAPRCGTVSLSTGALLPALGEEYHVQRLEALYHPVAGKNTVPNAAHIPRSV